MAGHLRCLNVLVYGLESMACQSGLVSNGPCAKIKPWVVRSIASTAAPAKVLQAPGTHLAARTGMDFG